MVRYNQLDKIDFPVFKLPSENWSSKDGLLFLDGQLLDDKNMPGKTLGVRRLQTPHSGIVPLKHMIEDKIGILKQPSYTPYIDNLGRVFLYEKTIMVPLKPHAIKRVDRLETYSLLRLRAVPFPIKVKRPPADNIGWANLLYLYDSPWLLYSYSTSKIKSTKRKI